MFPICPVRHNGMAADTILPHAFFRARGAQCKRVYLVQYFFYFAPILNFKLKTVQDTMLGKLYLANTYKGLVTLVTRRTIASFEFKVS
jgi:hypothetical protein